MPSYYLKLYKHDHQKKLLMRYTFYHREEFVPWPDKSPEGEWMNDEVSSFRFRAPKGWAIRFYKHRDPKSKDRSRKFESNGLKIKINKEDIPWNDEASAHEWIKL